MWRFWGTLGWRGGIIPRYSPALANSTHPSQCLLWCCVKSTARLKLRSPMTWISLTCSRRDRCLISPLTTSEVSAGRFREISDSIWILQYLIRAQASGYFSSFERMWCSSFVWLCRYCHGHSTRGRNWISSNRANCRKLEQTSLERYAGGYPCARFSLYWQLLIQIRPIRYSRDKQKWQELYDLCQRDSGLVYACPYDQTDSYSGKSWGPYHCRDRSSPPNTNWTSLFHASRTLQDCTRNRFNHRCRQHRLSARQAPAN